MYSTMNCYRKPEPQMIETKSIDELSMNAQSDSWLTVLIVKCAEIAGESATLGLIPIAHIDDLRFLAKLAMRFILAVIHAGRDSVSQWILTTFEDALLSATRRRITKCERTPPAFIFYVFDFLYHYINTEEVRKKRAVWEKLHQFWKSMLDWMVKDEHGHMQPLIVKTAMLFGMEKRCILWMEFYMDQLRNKNKKEDKLEGEVETSYYFTLMNLYARIHELNGVRGSYARLSKAHIGHVYGKISMQEALGDVASAATLSAMTGKGKPFDPRESIRKLIDEHNSLEEYPKDKQIEYEEHIKSLKNLSNWMQNDKDFGPSPQVFAKTIEPRAIESTILKMIQDGEVDCVVNDAIEKAKMKTIERLSECGLGGSCSFETTSSLIAQVHQLDEISRFKDASVESLTRAESEFWKSIQRRTDDGEQRMDFLEPILRVRKSMLTIRMKPLGDMQKNLLRSKIVEVHLQSARIARLSGCQERAQLAIINAKKVLPFDNRIVLEEAKLQLQTSDELSGMNLLDSIIDKTFGELSKHYGDTQQSRNLDLQRTAKSMIDLFPTETKNLFSSVQMLRISQMIKAGNTIGFEKIYNDTMNLLNSFVSSGVMYEAAWLLDYLFHYNERNRHVLPLLKAYKEVAKFETNHVLQARAVERMMSLWLSNTRKMSGLISSGKASAGAKAEMMVNIKDMNREISNAHERIGLRAFYHAYAVLVRHLDHQDEDVFRTIKGIMQQLIFRMPHQCMWQSVYLLRQDIAEVKNRYMEVLTNVKRKAPCFTTLIDQVPGKVDSDQCKLSTKVEGLKTLFREKKYDPKELIIDRRIDGECKIIGGIMVPIRSEIDGSVHDISLPEGFEESCLVPDRYLIHDFSDKVKVLHSKTKPVLIELITKAGRKVRLICKKEDDLTKDYHFTKMVEMCNDLLIKDEQTRIQSMAATTYSVIPLAKHGGIIEFMEGVTSFYETIDKHMTKSPSEWNQQVQKWATQMKTLSKDKKVEFFRNEMCEKSPLVMSKWFRCEYPEAGKWFASRKLFAKSSAVMSIIGYIFGLGDRHTKNLMVHVPTGKCVHVDFDMIFNKGELLSVPEVVPFRLTRNMVNGMGEVALDGEFRAVCEQTLRVFRENSYEIEKYIADLPNLVSDFNLKDFDMTEAKRLISGRLRGQIMTAKLYRGNPILHPMQVSQLASSLIELATSDEKLCEMFEGWMPTM
uniref:non-specific serine/threonine protein kinase n=1 Tax=Caenorhabditis japonica TaxID=281687 RepID=A0A8R1HGQ2_CAEJA